MIFFAHENNPLNPGDSSCSPGQYFDFGKMVSTIPVSGLADLRMAQGDTLVLGGGGLLNEVFLPDIEATIKGNAKMIIWSIGSNRHYWSGLMSNQISALLMGKKQALSEWCRRRFTRSIYTPREREIIQSATCSGLRDYQHEFQILPCPSCMHEVFDDLDSNNFDCHEIGVFGHQDFFPLPSSSKMSEFDYIGQSINQVVANIASCKVIVTSSYHCAYWAYLLDKKVKVMAFSTKHLYLRKLVDHARKSDLSFLDWCRTQNKEFRTKIESHL